MEIKANFHFHTADDPMDAVNYSLKEGIDHAATHGFEVLAITCHRKVVPIQPLFDYAGAKNILLIQGVELNIAENSNAWGRHVLVLNAHTDAEKVKTFKELAAYRMRHPESFMVAPHPYLYGNFSLHGFLEKYIHLFDAVEHSWFYTRHMNRNRKARAVAKKYNLPFVATSDTHFLDFFHKNYAVIRTAEKTPDAIFAALRKHDFQNITMPSKISDLLIKQGAFFLKTYTERKFTRRRSSVKRAIALTNSKNRD